MPDEFKMIGSFLSFFANLFGKRAKKKSQLKEYINDLRISASQLDFIDGKIEHIQLDVVQATHDISFNRSVVQTINTTLFLDTLAICKERVIRSPSTQDPKVAQALTEAFDSLEQLRARLKTVAESILAHNAKTGSYSMTQGTPFASTVSKVLQPLCVTRSILSDYRNIIGDEIHRREAELENFNSEHPLWDLS